jgi:hypothetical protein
MTQCCYSVSPVLRRGDKRHGRSAGDIAAMNPPIHSNTASFADHATIAQLEAKIAGLIEDDISAGVRIDYARFRCNRPMKATFIGLHGASCSRIVPGCDPAVSQPVAGLWRKVVDRLWAAARFLVCSFDMP